MGAESDQEKEKLSGAASVASDWLLGIYLGPNLQAVSFFFFFFTMPQKGPRGEPIAGVLPKGLDEGAWVEDAGKTVADTEWIPDSRQEGWELLMDRGK